MVGGVDIDDEFNDDCDDAAAGDGVGLMMLMMIMACWST